VTAKSWINTLALMNTIHNVKLTQKQAYSNETKRQALIIVKRVGKQGQYDLNQYQFLQSQVIITGLMP
jgi:hypothetical protein